MHIQLNILNELDNFVNKFKILEGVQDIFKFWIREKAFKNYFKKHSNIVTI